MGRIEFFLALALCEDAQRVFAQELEHVKLGMEITPADEHNVVVARRHVQRAGAEVHRLLASLLTMVAGLDSLLEELREPMPDLKLGKN